MQILADRVIVNGPPDYMVMVMALCVMKWPKVILRGLWQGVYSRNGHHKTCFMMGSDHVC